jgi:peptidoglycan-N-acetylglucosamine deacetylase
MKVYDTLRRASNMIECRLEHECKWRGPLRLWMLFRRTSGRLLLLPLRGKYLLEIWRERSRALARARLRLGRTLMARLDGRRHVIPPAHSRTAAPMTAIVPATKAGTANCPGNPNALPLSRIVEVDTTGGPGFGSEHFQQLEFLDPKEIVLTFDDSPWPNNTPMVLEALASHCLKATFFPVGKFAARHPEILKQVAVAGHTIGSHTWSHPDLSKKSKQDAIREIEMGASAIQMALGGPTAPFFRFPHLSHHPEMETYLRQRNIAIFSCDLYSFDFHKRKPAQVIRSVMTKLQRRGKGIILMHDRQRATAEALPALLNHLKEGGYKVVHMVPRAPLRTLPQYDELVIEENELPRVNTRPAVEPRKVVRAGER